MLKRIIEWSVGHRIVVLLAAAALSLGGFWALLRTPIDAIPDLSDVQVIVMTEWPGQAPQLVEDQITYPLSVELLKVPHTKVVRGTSQFGLSAVYVVFDDGTLLPAWHDVLDVIAAHDLLLASGHLSSNETVVLFRAAREHGVQRLLVNHPKMAFLHWNDEAATVLQELDAYLELGILPDLLGDAEHSSLTLTTAYPTSLLVFGGDLGHAHHPGPADAVGPWLADLEHAVGPDIAKTIMTTQTRSLLT